MSVHHGGGGDRFASVDGPGSSGQWPVRRNDLADSIETERQFGSDRLGVSKDPPASAHRSLRPPIHHRDSDYWTATDGPPPPPPPAAGCAKRAAVQRDLDDEPGFVQGCMNKARGLFRDLKDLDAVNSPDPTFVGKLRYIATKDGRTGVSITIAVLIALFLLALVGCGVAWQMSRSSAAAETMTVAANTFRPLSATM
jgi:hypothetical protein